MPGDGATSIFGRGGIPPPTRVGALVRRCRVIWKQRLPLKIRIFGWLLVRRHLMTRAMHHHLVPGAIVNCPLCDGEVRGLLPPVYRAPDGPGSMADRGGCSSHCIFRRRILELLHKQLIQTGDGVEASFRHLMGDLDPHELGHLQGRNSLRQYHSTWRGGFILLMEQRRLRPLTPSTPVMLDMYPYVIISMTLGDTILGVFPPSFKKNNIHDQNQSHQIQHFNLRVNFWLSSSREKLFK